MTILEIHNLIFYRFTITYLRCALFTSDACFNQFRNILCYRKVTTKRWTDFIIKLFYFPGDSVFGNQLAGLIIQKNLF